MAVFMAAGTARRADNRNLAEGVGFEPTGTRIPKLFKSFAFGRSAIPPEAPILTRPHFHRKCTNTRPKLRESFSTRWYRGLMSG
jgi:hypothetical protein